MDLTPSRCFFVLVLVFVQSAFFFAQHHDSPVQVDCQTPGLMLFQIYHPTVLSLLQSPDAKELFLFSAEEMSGRPLPGCQENYTISRAVTDWSRPFHFLRYGGNSSCAVKSYQVDRDNSAQRTFVVDIFIKVLATKRIPDSPFNKSSPGRRGKIRLSCTMLAAQEVESSRVNLQAELFSPAKTPPVNETTGSPIRKPVIDVLTAQLAGSLMLRFFKLLPETDFPIPAVSVSEGEDIYLVVALKLGGSFAVLRPFNCVIRSVINPFLNSTEIRDFTHRQSSANSSFANDFTVLDQGCQTAPYQWEMSYEAAERNIFRLYYTKFVTPAFTGTLKLSAKCSVNLCTQQNSNACINRPVSLLNQECFVTTRHIPNFPFHSETITGLIELPTANLLMNSAAGTVTPALTFQSLMHTQRPESSLRHQTSFQPTVSRVQETKDDRSLHRRNTTSATSDHHQWSNDWTTRRTMAMPIDPVVNKSATGSAQSAPDIFDNTTFESPQKLKYCFLQSTVTAASAVIVVILVVSVILILIAVLVHCRLRKRHDRAAILDDLQ